MRSLLVWAVLLGFVVCAGDALAATGRVLKVLPQYLDKEGRASLSPSLYERDAYQAMLRNHPGRRSGLKYAIQWKTKGTAWDPVILRIELRGIAEGNLPRSLVLEQPVKTGGWFSHWSNIILDGDQYRLFGTVTAWRVTLREGDKVLAEQKSFLW